MKKRRKEGWEIFLEEAEAVRGKAHEAQPWSRREGACCIYKLIILAILRCCFFVFVFLKQNCSVHLLGKSKLCLVLRSYVCIYTLTNFTSTNRQVIAFQSAENHPQ